MKKKIIDFINDDLFPIVGSVMIAFIVIVICVFVDNSSEIKRLFTGLQIEDVSDGMDMTKCKKCNAIIISNITKTINTVHVYSEETKVENEVIYKINNVKTKSDNAFSKVKEQYIDDCSKLSRYDYHIVKINEPMYEKFNLKYKLCFISDNFRRSDWKEFEAWYPKNKDKKFYYLVKYVSSSSRIPAVSFSGGDFRMVGKVIHHTPIRRSYSSYTSYSCKKHYICYSEEELSKYKNTIKSYIELGWKFKECSPIFYFAICRGKYGLDYAKI